jgi:Carboxypeptidase regulatory-like domain
MYRAKEKMLFLLVVVVVVFVASALRAKVGGKITGVVRDQTGSVIPGAAVVVTNTASGVKQTTATDQDGVFTFPISSQVPINAVAGPI